MSLKICLKKKLTVGDKTLEKHQEGFLIAISWGDEDYYLVDFGGKTYKIPSSECDILNL